MEGQPLGGLVLVEASSGSNGQSPPLIPPRWVWVLAWFLALVALAGAAYEGHTAAMGALVVLVLVPAGVLPSWLRRDRT